MQSAVKARDYFLLSTIFSISFIISLSVTVLLKFLSGDTEVGELLIWLVFILAYACFAAYTAKRYLELKKFVNTLASQIRKRAH